MYNLGRSVLDQFENMAVAGAEQTHGGAQLAAELAELLSVPRKLLRRRACRTAEVVHICPIYFVSYFVEYPLVL